MGADFCLLLIFLDQNILLGHNYNQNHFVTIIIATFGYLSLWLGHPPSVGVKRTTTHLSRLRIITICLFFAKHWTFWAGLFVAKAWPYFLFAWFKNYDMIDAVFRSISGIIY
jgi:hypothetical protein